MVPRSIALRIARRVKRNPRHRIKNLPCRHSHPPPPQANALHVHATPVLNMESFMQQAVQALRQLEANPPRNDATPHAQPPQPQPEGLSTASQPSSTPNPSVKRFTIRSVMPASCFPVSGDPNRDFLHSSPANEPTAETSHWICPSRLRCHSPHATSII